MCCVYSYRDPCIVCNHTRYTYKSAGRTRSAGSPCMCLNEYRTQWTYSDHAVRSTKTLRNTRAHGTVFRSRRTRRRLRGQRYVNITPSTSFARQYVSVVIKHTLGGRSFSVASARRSRATRRYIVLCAAEDRATAIYTRIARVTCTA